MELTRQQKLQLAIICAKVDHELNDPTPCPAFTLPEVELLLSIIEQRPEREPVWRCPGCGQPTLDGKSTCGQWKCGSGTGR